MEPSGPIENHSENAEASQISKLSDFIQTLYEKNQILVIPSPESVPKCQEKISVKKTYSIGSKNKAHLFTASQNS